ncbi:hypothetical protein BLNAU_3631 [Blattamonas nauphoetae]|uniref:Uncharacterized protein n=1 Tax=Blattamonas nauphoetae TaxID=2049346 RepID=A0ABQ9YCQ5_9EUKA|nr:hypothetical protein BLNAU_3631 [Blattamonas nauphoetae]
MDVSPRYLEPLKNRDNAIIVKDLNSNPFTVVLNTLVAVFGVPLKQDTERESTKYIYNLQVVNDSDVKKLKEQVQDGRYVVVNQRCVTVSPGTQALSFLIHQQCDLSTFDQVKRAIASYNIHFSPFIRPNGDKLINFSSRTIAVKAKSIAESILGAIPVVFSESSLFRNRLCFIVKKPRQTSIALEDVVNVMMKLKKRILSIVRERGMIPTEYKGHTITLSLTLDKRHLDGNTNDKPIIYITPTLLGEQLVEDIIHRLPKSEETIRIDEKYSFSLHSFAICELNTIDSVARTYTPKEGLRVINFVPKTVRNPFPFLDPFPTKTTPQSNIQSQSQPESIGSPPLDVPSVPGSPPLHPVSPSVFESRSQLFPTIQNPNPQPRLKKPAKEFVPRLFPQCPSPTPIAPPSEWFSPPPSINPSTASERNLGTDSMSDTHRTSITPPSQPPINNTSAWVSSLPTTLHIATSLQPLTLPERIVVAKDVEPDKPSFSDSFASLTDDTRTWATMSGQSSWFSSSNALSISHVSASNPPGADSVTPGFLFSGNFSPFDPFDEQGSLNTHFDVLGARMNGMDTDEAQSNLFDTQDLDTVSSFSLTRPSFDFLPPTTQILPSFGSGHDSLTHHEHPPNNTP